ncbi:MAG: hypothetical protein IKH28_10495 [Lachnospiraceae bacterium]|nr:hypothetical protein [Lachnospiraceae bacterium]
MANEKEKVLKEEDLKDVSGGFTSPTELSMICSNCKTTTTWKKNMWGTWACSCGCTKNWTIYQYNDWLNSQNK